MMRYATWLLLFAGLFAGGRTMSAQDASNRKPVKPGIEVLFEKRLDLIRGKRVGLITN